MPDQPCPASRAEEAFQRDQGAETDQPAKQGDVRPQHGTPHDGAQDQRHGQPGS